MPDRIIVVELPDEARAAAEHLGQAGMTSDVLIVALEPSARAILKEEGFESVDTIPFLDNASHANLLRASTGFDRLIEQGVRFSTADGFGDIYAKGCSAFIGTRLALMLKAIEVLEGMRRVYPESTYCFCPRTPAYRHSDSVFVQPAEGFLALLGPRFCQHHCLSWSMIPLPGSTPTQAPRSRRETWWRRAADRLIAGAWLLACRMQSRSKTILSITSWQVEAMDKLGSSVHARFPQVKALRLSRGRRGTRRELWDAFAWMLLIAVRRESSERMRDISQDVVKNGLGRSGEVQLRKDLQRSVQDFMARHGEHFRYRDISLIEEIGDEIQYGLIPYLVELRRVAQAQACILRHLRPALVLSWASAEAYQTLGRAAARAGIPAMLVPMKTLVEQQNDLESLGQRQVGQEMVTNDFPFAAVQSPLAMKFMQHAGYRGQLVHTGPLIWAKIDEPERQRQRARFFQEMGAPGKVIVYAPSMKKVHNYYVTQTLDEVLSSMADIVEIVSEMDGNYLILRLHPDWAANHHVIEMLIDLPRGVTISLTGRHLFSGVLALADVLISNASTTSEEALLNGVPVVLYDKWARYNHLDAPEVRTGIPDDLSPAYYVSAKAHLGSTLDWVQRNHAPGTPLPRARTDRYIFQEDLSHNFYDFVGRITGQAV